MKYFAIAPLAHLDMIKEEKHHMVITPFLMDKRVMEFYREQKETGAELMLDNGEFEAVAILQEDYIGFVRELDPDFIILPDAWKDPERTFHFHETMLDRLEKAGLHPRKIFVPHGDNILQYINCLRVMINEMNVDIIGLTFAEWGDTSGMVRPFLSHHLGTRPYHFLGLYNTKELWTAGPEVLSVDSSFPFKAALQNKLLSTCNGMALTNRFDFNARLTEKQVALAKLNLKIMHHLVEEKPKVNPFEVLR